MNGTLVLDSKLQSEKNIAWWLYLAHGITFIFTLTTLSWIPLIINFIKRSDSEGTFVRTHHSWQIRSFIWFWVWMMVAGVLFFSFIGIPLAWIVFGVAYLWKAYRLIKGWMDLNANKAMPV